MRRLLCVFFAFVRVLAVDVVPGSSAWIVCPFEVRGEPPMGPMATVDISHPEAGRRTVTLHHCAALWYTSGEMSGKIGIGITFHSGRFTYEEYLFMNVAGLDKTRHKLEHPRHGDIDLSATVCVWHEVLPDLPKSSAEPMLLLPQENACPTRIANQIAEMEAALAQSKCSPVEPDEPLADEDARCSSEPPYLWKASDWLRNMQEPQLELQFYIYGWTCSVSGWWFCLLGIMVFVSIYIVIASEERYIKANEQKMERKIDKLKVKIASLRPGAVPQAMADGWDALQIAQNLCLFMADHVRNSLPYDHTLPAFLGPDQWTAIHRNGCVSVKTIEALFHIRSGGFPWEHIHKIVKGVMPILGVFWAHVNYDRIEGTDTRIVARNQAENEGYRNAFALPRPR